MSRLGALLERGVAEGAFPGAILHVRREGEVLLEEAVGATRLAGGVPVEPGTFFDLASVSKVLGTTAMAMRLCARALLSLEDRVCEWLPQVSDPAKRDITVRHLLAHTSGLPAWRPLFERYRGRPFEDARAALIEAAADEPLEAAPGTRCEYSDLGFILLGALLEAVSGARLDLVWEEEVRRPLGIQEAFYVDLAGPRPPGVFAATEHCPWRERVIEAAVHDDNAYVMGGVAGHAGLFSTARAVGAFGSALLEAQAGRSAWLPAAVVDEFWRKDPFGLGATYALGWDTPAAAGSQAGSKMPRAVGHLGFTGTSLWIDREARLTVVLLTNRVHPTRENQRIKEIRPVIHDAVVESVGR